MTEESMPIEERVARKTIEIRQKVVVYVGRSIK